MAGRLSQGLALGLAALAARPGAVTHQASGVHLSPITVAIPYGETTGSFVVRNEGDTPVVFTVQAFSWSNDATRMVLDRTDDVVVFPSRLTIGARETRRVRVAARVRAGEVERAYRLVLEQAPAGSAGAASGVAMRLRFNLPVFLRPERPVATVELGVPQVQGGTLRLPIRNAGRLHVTPRRIAVSGLDANGATLWTRELEAWYLLAGEGREYAVPLDPSACGRTARLLAEARFLEGEALSVRQSNPIDRDACRRP